MINNLKPYPAYKDSGVPWLGKVPEHWEMRPAFGAYAPNLGRNTGMREKTVLSLSYGRIIVKPPEKLHGLVPESFETYQIVNPGDIVLRTTDLQNDHTSLRVGKVQQRGIITSAYLSLRTKSGVHPDYGYQLLNVWDITKAIYGYGSGLRQNLDFSHFRRMLVIVPPPSEQSAIVRFLDYMDRRIRRYIRAKQKLINLLEEQKQAIIHRAVTGQIDVRTGKPYPAYKPSGIEWLGDVPEHWEVRRLKRAFRKIVGGSTPSSTETHYWGGDIVWVTPADVSKTVRLKTSLRRITQDGLMSCSSEIVPAGSIIVTSRAPVGNVAIAETELCTNQGCKALVAALGVAEPMFGFYVLTTLKDELESLATGTTFTEISTSRIGNVPMPLPPLLEQADIVRFLNEVIALLVTTIEQCRREIQLRHEYRTCLIADVVTGKIDVREAVTRLPDEVEEPEPLEEAEALSEGQEGKADNLIADEMVADSDEVES
jgi:type I restriction enzyme S subunit